MDQLWAPWRAKYVTGDEPAGDGCVLCALIPADTTSEYVVESTETTVTVLNRYPYSSGHLLIFPRRHVGDLLSMTDDEAAAVMLAARRSVRALGASLKPDGFNVGINQGSAGGASVDHFHLHVVPRWHGDTNFMPVVGDTKVLPTDLARTGTEIRAAYSESG